MKLPSFPMIIFWVMYAGCSIHRDGCSARYPFVEHTRDPRAGRV